MTYYNEFKEVAKQPTLLASLVGFINPVTIIPIIAFGAVMLVAKQRNKLETEKEQLLASKDALVKRTQVLENELEDYYDAEYEEVEAEEFQRLDQPLNSSESAETHVAPTVDATVTSTVAPPLHPTVANGTFNDASNGSANGSSTAETMTDEALKKELLRQTMSELGKRSAAKRAEKKKAGDN